MFIRVHPWFTCLGSAEENFIRVPAGLRLGLLAFFACASALAAPLEFWVSPQGSDVRGDGSAHAPWQTIERARDHIREKRLNVAMRADIVVQLAPGDYPVARPIAFGPADSGSAGHLIVYRSSGGPGAARFRGGVRVTGWTKVEGGVWRASVPRDIAFRTLYENGRRARLARAPNYAPDPNYPGYFGEYLKSEAGTGTSIVFRAGELDPAAWRPGQRGEIWWWGHQGKYNWGMFPSAITGIDASTRTISFPQQDSPAAAGERFFVQGFRELLDAPGEFHLDEAAGTLSYWPMDGDPNAQEIVAPRVGEIFHLEGGGIGVPVHDLKFEGLAVSETDYAADSVKIIGPPRAAFFLLHASRIELRDCHLFNLGNLGVRILQDGAENRIIGCWIERTGEGGIQIWNVLKRSEAPAGRSERHVIRDCRIHDFHEVRTSTHWCGVQLFCVSDCEVAHSEIFNSGRYAISLRGNFSTEAGSAWVGDLHPSAGNRFHHLRAWRGGADSGDMGFLHAAHLNPTGGPNINTWEQIVLRDVAAHPSMNDEAPNGIFLDHPQSCQHQVLRNIVVSAVQGAPFRTNRNPAQTLENVSWQEPFDPAAIDEAHIGLTAEFPRAYRPVLVKP